MAQMFDFERAAYHRSIGRLGKEMEHLKSQVEEVIDLLQDAGYTFAGYALTNEDFDYDLDTLSDNEPDAD